MLEMTELEKQRAYQAKNGGSSPSNVKTERGKGTISGIHGECSGRTAAKRRKGGPGTDQCTCAPGTKSQSDDQKCSGCQNNIRRAHKRR